jgi:hypothetical protein
MALTLLLMSNPPPSVLPSPSPPIQSDKFMTISYTNCPPTSFNFFVFNTVCFSYIVAAW